MSRGQFITAACCCAAALLASGVSCQSGSGLRRHPLPRRNTERTYNSQPPTVPAETPVPTPPANEIETAPMPAAAPMPSPATDSNTVPKPVAATPASERTEVAPPAGTAGTEKLRALHQQAAESIAALPGYTAQLRRREQIHGKDKPEEVILFKSRREPWSVYFQWLGSQNQGRQAVFVKSQHGGMIHTLLAKGDIPLMPAGKVVSLLPDSPFVVSSSRHSITEAGMGPMVEHFGRLVASQEAKVNRLGRCSYVGRLHRSELPQALEAVEQQFRGSEPALTSGGKRYRFFDPANHLPILLITYDPSGHDRILLL